MVVLLDLGEFREIGDRHFAAKLFETSTIRRPRGFVRNNHIGAKLGNHLSNYTQRT